MYTFDKHKKIICFYDERDGKRVGFADWNILQKDILMELCDNGFGEISEDTVSVIPGNIYQLNEIERKMLGLPAEYPYDMYVETNESTLSQDDFQYKVSFYSFYPGGKVLPYQVQGCFVKVSGLEYMFSKEQFALYQAICEFNSLGCSDRSKRANLIHFSEIKNLSQSAAAKLDSYLINTNVCVPSKIKVLVDYENDALHLSASIDDMESEQFTERFDKKDQVKDTYLLKEKEGKRVHVVFKDEQIEQLHIIKKYDKVADRKVIDKIMESPESIFDADDIDIHEFYSDRVLKMGLYRPKYYSFVCPYKSEWIPGIRVNDNINGTKNLFFDKKEKIDEIEEKVNEAIKKGDQCIEWENTLINVNDIMPQIATLKEQCFKKSFSPKKIKKDSSDEVLIIEENAEELGYSEHKGTVLPKVEHYYFLSCHSLNPTISLKEHQKEGIAWLQYLYTNKCKGCLLADDMGLGKTLQILYFLEWHRMYHNQSHRPYLIVAPISLLDNWQREYAKFFVGNRMELSVIMSKDLEKDLNPKEIERLEKMQLILTNYETVRNRQLNFCAVDFAAVVLDEAQKAKTPGSLITNSVKALKAEFKIAVTGTPVENTLVDLWCIMDFSIPGLLGNAKEFSLQYQNPLKNNDSDIEQLGKKLRTKLGCYFERRLKTDVAKDLPPKRVYRKKAEMSKLQKQLYHDELKAIQATRHEGKMPQGLMFKAISAFRQICDCPYLSNMDYSVIQLEELVNSSSKLHLTVSILDEIQQRNEKVIIFTDHKDTQRLLQNVIYRKYGLGVHIINGETPATANERSQKMSRQQTIDEFQAQMGFNVIIMSPLAAGMGLNIIGANNVIHYSRFWNPAKEQQATDRAYRIGQQKVVNVYYPMSVSKDFKSFDVIIDALLAKKSELADATLFPTMRTEIKQQELYDSLLGEKVESSKMHFIDEKEIDLMDDYKFEAFVAALYKKMGFKTMLTSTCGDKGIDVLAMNGDICYAIQVKHSRSCKTIGTDGAYEASSGCKYYTNKLGMNFEPILLTNSSFTRSVIEFADNVHMMLIDRPMLLDMLASHTVCNEDVVTCELHRLGR